MDQLPNDTISEIVKHVSIWDFKQLGQTCSRFNLTLHQNNLWQSLCKRYDVSILANNYQEAIKTALQKTKKILADSCYRKNGLYMNYKDGWLPVVWPELIKLSQDVVSKFTHLIPDFSTMLVVK